MKVQLTNRKFWNFHAILYVEQTDRWKGNGKMKGITGFFLFPKFPISNYSYGSGLKVHCLWNGCFQRLQDEVNT